MLSQITIIGTGLIGGSFGRAIRKYGFHGRIVGCDRDPVLERALQIGAIDSAVADPVEACRASQVVMLATPVGGIIDFIERLGPLLSPDVLLTDVGSTKTEVLARACQVFGAAAATRFLAGHPMAGKERSGIDQADPELFRDAPWFLISGPRQNLLAGHMNDFVVLLEMIGARIVTMTSEQHDRLCAWTSHLPQMVAIGLAATLMDEFGKGEFGEGTSAGDQKTATLADVHKIAGRQLREMTRTSASPFSMWRDVALTNTRNLEYALHHLEQRLAHIRENLRTPELRQEFEKANSFAEKPLAISDKR